MVRRGVWTDEEDATLRAQVQRFAEGSWSEVATRLPGRTAKQCRERWKFNLSPDINKASWSSAEDAMLVRLQRTSGNRWAFIARSFNGRTENAVKTRFRSLQRAARRKWSYEEDRLLLEMRTQRFCRWETIAAALPRRSKNGVKMRYKQLISRPPHILLPPLPPPMHSTAHPSQHHHPRLDPYHHARIAPQPQPAMTPLNGFYTPRAMCMYGPSVTRLSATGSPRIVQKAPQPRVLQQAPKPAIKREDDAHAAIKREDEVLAAKALLNLCAI